MDEKEFENLLKIKDRSFQALKKNAHGLIENALNRAEIKYLSVTSRVKDMESSLNKFRNKKYRSPLEEMTDIVGARVILYLSTDVDRTGEIVERLFKVDTENSIDKRKPKSLDSVGYRSLHLVCSLGDNRVGLPEYSELCDIPFEVQIRTALEHAWAEIEHKENYKASLDFYLPSALQRRLLITAGTLELVDRELSDIASLAEEYRKEINDNSPKIENDPLTITSLMALTARYMGENSVSSGKYGKLEPRHLKELSDFGVNTIHELRNLFLGIPTNFYPIDTKRTPIGILRDAMILSDYKKYLDQAYPGGFLFRGMTVERLAAELKIDFELELSNRGIEVS